MSKLDELLAELDKRRTEFDIGERASFSVNAAEYDLLRSALREREGMMRIGVLHRTMSGEINFVQEVDKLPIAVHAMIPVFAAAEGK